MYQPPGYHNERHPQHVCHLQKSIYGLKQSPRAWFHRLRDCLVKMNFKEGMADQSLFVYICGGVTAYFMVYMDDMVITSSSPDFTSRIVDELSKEFRIKYLGDLSYFLGIHVTCMEGGLFLSQQQYVANLLFEEDLANLKPATTPMETKMDLTNSTKAE